MGGTIQTVREKPRAGRRGEDAFAVGAHQEVDDCVVRGAVDHLVADDLPHGLGDGGMGLIEGLAGALRAHEGAVEVLGPLFQVRRDVFV